MKRALIIVDHGSVREAANHMLEQVADLLRQRTQDAVYTAHMELASPTIADAFDCAAAHGAESVFIFPYFLAPGRHSREDIPRLCAQAASQHPQIQWHCSGPIGLDPLLAELILRRVEDCRQHDWRCPECPSQGICRPSAE